LFNVVMGHGACGHRRHPRQSRCCRAFRPAHRRGPDGLDGRAG
jgi:hypothetical protein